MKLYLEQKELSWRDRFAVKGEGGQDLWSAQGEVFTLWRKLHVYGADGEEEAFVKRKVVSVLPRYFISAGEELFELAREVELGHLGATLAHPRYVLKGPEWEVNGDFLAHDYEVLDGGAEVMRVSKAYVHFGDFYEIDVAVGRNVLVCLCVALAIECVKLDAREIGGRWFIE